MAINSGCSSPFPCNIQTQMLQRAPSTNYCPSARCLLMVWIISALSFRDAISQHISSWRCLKDCETYPSFSSWAKRQLADFVVLHFFNTMMFLAKWTPKIKYQMTISQIESMIKLFLPKYSSDSTTTTAGWRHRFVLFPVTMLSVASASASLFFYSSAGCRLLLWIWLLSSIIGGVWHLQPQILLRAVSGFWGVLQLRFKPCSGSKNHRLILRKSITNVIIDK